jgi:hypothetical protein
MHPALLDANLRARFRRETWACLAGGIGLLTVAGVVLVITFWALHAFAFLTLGPWLRPDETTLLLVAAGLVALLFFANAVADRAELAEWRVGTGTVSEKVICFYVPRVGMLSNVNPFHPDTARTFVRILSGIALLGPHLATEAVDCFLRALRLSRLDVPGIARVLALLLSRPGRTPFTGLLQRHPDLDLGEIIPQLLELPGVVRFQSEPAGLGLTEDLRRELAGGAAFANHIRPETPMLDGVADVFTGAGLDQPAPQAWPAPAGGSGSRRRPLVWGDALATVLIRFGCGAVLGLLLWLLLVPVIHWPGGTSRKPLAERNPTAAKTILASLVIGAGLHCVFTTPRHLWPWRVQRPRRS